MERVKGTKDYLPEEFIKLEWIISKVKRVFESYGFEPLETPALELLETLTKKGGLGEEAIKDIFKFQDKAGRWLGLRFDLTVPLARVLAQNPQLPKPFKRYQIGKVWRYEETKAGRYREFWQADIDTVGSSSLEADAEILACTTDCLKAIGFKDFGIHLNNRKVWSGFFRQIAVPEDMFDVLRIIDKLEKIGLQEVKKGLEKLGLSSRQIDAIIELLELRGSNKEILENAKKLIKDKVGVEGLEELEKILRLVENCYDYGERISVDLSIVRGLEYYTGPVFEARVSGKLQVGSVGGGGRYDKLLRLYGSQDLPATGISLGLDRILDLTEAEGIANLPKSKVEVFIAPVSEEVRLQAFKLAKTLRDKGLKVQVDLTQRKLGKQLEYVDQAEIPWVIILGVEELKERKVKLRNMFKGEEKVVRLEEIADQILAKN